MIELLFPIGKNSDGTNFQISLLKDVHYFISFSEEYQLNDLIKRLLQLKEQNLNIAFQLFLSIQKRRVPEDILPDSSVFFFYKDVPLEGYVNKKSHLIAYLNKELNKRIKNNVPEKEVPIIVLMEDVWDIANSKHKSTGIQFLHQLLNGPSNRIVFMLASVISYRNLFRQLSSIHPKTIEQLKKKGLITQELNQATDLGIEIIYTPDDFVFLKIKNSMDMVKLYKL